MIDKAIELSKEVNAIWSVEDCKLIHKALLQAKKEREDVLKLLKVARCVNIGCDQKGTLTGTDKNGDAVPEPCQWCYERQELINQLPFDNKFQNDGTN